MIRPIRLLTFPRAIDLLSKCLSVTGLSSMTKINTEAQLLQTLKPFVELQTRHLSSVRKGTEIDLPVNLPVRVGTSWYSRSLVLCLQIISIILGIPGRSSRGSPPSSIRQRQWTVPTLYNWRFNFYVASAWWLFECRNGHNELNTAYSPEVHMGVIG